MRRGTLTIQARYVYPVEGPPIENGSVTIEQGRIAWVGESSERHGDMDLGNVAIVPGFVNAHTHLELEELAGNGDSGDGDEVAWLKRVVEQKRAGTETSQRAAVGRNLEASLVAGTTFLADTTTAGLSWDQVARAPVRAVVFAETIGLKRDRGLETSQAAWQWLSSIRPEAQVAACARPGLSPHAPYSTSGWLYHKAAASRMPLCDPPGGDARGTEVAQVPRRPAQALPRGARRLG